MWAVATRFHCGMIGGKLSATNNNKNLMVANIIDAEKNWNFTPILGTITSEQTNDIYRVHIPKHNHMEDSPSWGLESNGKFSVKSAYNLINDGTHAGSVTKNHPHWKWLWK